MTNEWSSVIDLLTERTESGELTWEENPIAQNEFDLVLPRQAIKIYEEENRVGVSLKLYNEQGRLIDTATVWDNEGNNTARRLLEVVRRKVLRVEEALDQLKKALS